MFKNNKENINYMSKEEVEKLYEFQKKNFDSKIDEQKNRISELADIISARFGEDIVSSNINTTIKILQNNIKDVEKMYKIDLEASEKIIKKEIEKSEDKVNKNFEKAIQEQVKNYNIANSISNQHGKEIEKINELLHEKDCQILELSNELKDYIDGDLEYKKDIEDKFENTNKKINKINYHGITNKFDKKLQEESKEINEKINVLNVVSGENSEMIEDLAKKILDTNKWATTDITENKKNIDKINEKYVILNENINNNNKKTIELINPIQEEQEKLQQLVEGNNVKTLEEITAIKGLVESNKTEVFKLIEKGQKDLDKKLKASEIENKKVKEQLSKEINPIKEEQEKLQQLVEGNNVKTLEEISEIKGLVESNKTEVFKLIEKEQKDLDKKLKSNEVENKKVKEQLSKEINPIKEEQTKLQQLVEGNNVKTLEEISEIKGLVESNKTEVFKLIEKEQKNVDKKFNNIKDELFKDINVIKEKQNELANNKELEEKLASLKNAQKNYEDSIKKIDSKIIAEIEVVNEGVKANKNIIKEINNVVKSDIEEMSKKIQASKQEMDNLTIKFNKDIEQVKNDANNIFAKFDTTANENNKNINLKLDELSQKLEDSKLEIDNLKADFIANTEKTKKDIINDNKKFERHLSEQININDNQNKESFKKIEETIEDIRTSVSSAINEIGQNVLKLKEETVASIETQKNDEDIEQLKKEHEKYVVKVNNELNKINKSILNAQKKNLEANNNLQLKIKAYIDSKIEKVSGPNNIEDIISELQLSMLEREKLQKIEMEKLLNKKLKEIEKENERILKKKIEELNNNFITNNTIYKEEKLETSPRKKKNMYELIDTKQTLKRSAASKNNLENTNEGKSQILKFFYDDDDVN